MSCKLSHAVFVLCAAAVVMGRGGSLSVVASADDAASKGAKPVPFSLAKPDKPLIILETLVDNEGPFRFVLDTGAGATVISPALAEKLAIEPDDGQAPRKATGAGGSVDVRMGKVKSIGVGEAKIDELAVVIMDLSGIGRAIEMEIDGIIGYNFLKMFRVTIDYPQQTVTFEFATQPLRHAHAHNDYYHPRPLLDALERGFCSVEADIFLVDGELRVGHDRAELRPGRTLQSLYLDPLRDRIERNGGRVYPGGPPFTLLVDIKRDGAEVYEVLREVLKSYEAILCGVDEGRYRERAVQVVISGDCPRRAIAADGERYCAIDGRLSDLASADPAHVMPLISDRWAAHFSWRGEGVFPMAERDKLREVVQRAHAAGRRVRFWATPERPEIWRELLEAGVDHINTDQLDELRDFLLEQSAER